MDNFNEYLFKLMNDINHIYYDQLSANQRIEIAKQLSEEPAGIREKPGYKKEET